MALRVPGWSLVVLLSFAFSQQAFSQNRAPVISGTPPTTAVARTTYHFLPSGHDPDGNRLKWSIRNKPSWAAFSSTTGRLTGAPGISHVGTASNIVISVSDGRLTASLPAFSITISRSGSVSDDSSTSVAGGTSDSAGSTSPDSRTSSGNQPPVISGSPPTTVVARSTYHFLPTASDPEGQRLKYSINRKPSWASFSSSTGRLTGAPGISHVGTISNLVISVSDGRLTTSLPAFSITVTRTATQPPSGSNRTPVVAGTPSQTATVGTAYSFTPTGSDPDGDAITWSIAGKPGAASFNVSTGRLSWTPTSTGYFPNIVITATDSRGASASLPAFTITVGPTPVAGSAALSWQPPTQYTNGTSLPASGLSAFRIYRGTSASSLTRIAEVDARTTNFSVPNLARGTHYFAVTAVTTTGVESALSAIGSKTIP